MNPKNITTKPSVHSKTVGFGLTVDLVNNTVQQQIASQHTEIIYSPEQETTEQNQPNTLSEAFSFVGNVIRNTLGFLWAYNTPLTLMRNFLNHSLGSFFANNRNLTSLSNSLRFFGSSPNASNTRTPAKDMTFISGVSDNGAGTRHIERVIHIKGAKSNEDVQRGLDFARSLEEALRSNPHSMR